MPLEVLLVVNEDFKPDGDELKAAFDQAKKQKPRKVAEVTAREAVGNSKGMYKIVRLDQEDADAEPVGARRLEDYGQEELMILFASMGGKMSDKPMKRSEIIKFIRGVAAKVEVVDDNAEDPEGS